MSNFSESGLSDAQKHHRWCIDRAMELYDGGDQTGACASFLSDAGKHEGTQFIADVPLGIMLLMDAAGRGRAAFLKFLEGYNVI